MSTSEDVFLGHETSSYSQQNGDVLSSPTIRHGRATMESIKSVHENPFYKSFGIRHTAPRHVSRSEAHEESKRINSNGRSSSVDDDDDDIGEYRPGSGYVHKLLDKFSSLTAREESSLSHLKRSSSLDELQVENEATSAKPAAPRSSGIGHTSQKPSYLSSIKQSHRARSIESLNYSHHRPHHNLAPSQRHAETKWDKERQQLSPKSKRDSSSGAPDLELARDNIVIIENTSLFPSAADTDENEGIDKAAAFREVVPPDEMPKPNTVLTVRSIFESASAGTGLYSRRHKDSPLSPSSLAIRSGQTAASSQDSVSNRGSSHSPSPITSPRLSNDTHAKPNLLPSSSTVLKSDYIRHKSDSSVYPSSEAYRSSSASTSLIVESAALHLSSQQNDSQSATRSSSTSAFSSSSTAATINKTSELQAASIKGHKENHNADELPFMIFDKSKLKPRKDRPQRVTNYTQNEDEPKEVEEVDKDGISPKEAKKIFEVDDSARFNNGTDNNTPSPRRHFDANTRTAEKNLQDKKKVTFSKPQTTIVASGAHKHAVLVGEKSKNMENELDSKSSKPAAARRTNIEKPKTLSQEQPSEAENQLEQKEPNHPESSSGRTEATNEKNNSNSQTSITINEKSDKLSTNKRSYPNDTPTMNEQPLNKVSKDKLGSNEQPVKGIPSIVAQRLKKQYSDPSQVADDVVSSSDEPNDDSSDNVFSRKHLSPTPANSFSSEPESLSSEIETEIAAVRKKMEGSRSKASGPSPIFDSSQLLKKWKEKKQQEKASQEAVPPLDLSGLMDDQAKENQRVVSVVKPCNIVFIGENAKTSRSLLDKQRKVKINIYFNDSKTETFEYPCEETALEKYLEDHPHERDEILVLEDFSGGGDESCDDVEIDVFETPVTPRGNSDDDLLKANTSMSHTGSLQTYRGRYQQDYELGTILAEQEQRPATEPEPSVDPDKLMLRPAEEDDTNTYSTSSSSDILF